jgi:hypothetical protein
LLRGQGNRRRNSRHPRRIPSDLNNVKHLAVSTLAFRKSWSVVCSGGSD